MAFRLEAIELGAATARQGAAAGVNIRLVPAAPRPPDECPAIDEILDFCAGTALSESAESIQQHIDVCASCLDLVTGAINEWASVDPIGWVDVGCNFRPGQRVEGRFQIVRFMGRGGMGEVYEAIDLDTSERVALKAVLATSSDSAHLLRCFRREARLGRKVRHLNVCRIHPAAGGLEPALRAPVPYFTMEYIDGHTLHERLARATLSMDEVLAISEQVLRGLGAIHDAGVLHLDLKSSNVMLRRSGEHQAVIVDFGLARGALPRGRNGRHHALTGSLPYMPPEQILGRAPSRQNDVFAFGVVLFQMLTGQLPFPTTHPSTSSIVRRLVARAPRPSELNPHLPRWLDDVVRTCLADQENRFKDVYAVLAALPSR